MGQLTLVESKTRSFDMLFPEAVTLMNHKFSPAFGLGFEFRFNFRAYYSDPSAHCVFIRRLAATPCFWIWSKIVLFFFFSPLKLDFHFLWSRMSLSKDLAADSWWSWNNDQNDSYQTSQKLYWSNMLLVSIWTFPNAWGVFQTSCSESWYNQFPVHP